MVEFKIKDKNEIVNDILINIVENVPDINDVNVGSILRNLSEALGLEVSELYTKLTDVYTGTRIDTAIGLDLENLGELLGITRKQGTKSQGYLSFIRKTPATIDFTIPVGSIISTQPNTGDEEPLRFTVNANTTFLSAISAEQHTFIDGIFEYALTERFIDSISLMTGTAGSVGYTFQEGSDFEIVKDYSGLIIDLASVTDIDDCNALTDWNESVGAITPTLDTSDYKQGSASINIGKSTTTSTSIYYDKVIPSVIDGSGKNMYVWFKIEDLTAYNKINYIELIIGSGGNINNSYKLNVDASKLSVGWNRVEVDFTSSSIVKTGIPNRVAMNFIRLNIESNLATDIIALGELKMDFWIFAESEDYIGDCVRFLQTGAIPDNDTVFETDYKPLSKEVLCFSENVGNKFNSGKLKIFYKVSFVANIDSVNNYENQTGGTNIELDVDMRIRIKGATELTGKATVEALRQGVLGVEGVTSVSVNDMPLKSQTAEAHNHISFASTPTANTDYEVALNNTNFELTGTRGGNPITFVKNTDYYIEDSTVHWIDDLKDPDDGTNFFITYDYRWLGYVRLFVSGTSAPLPSEVVTNIDNAIYNTKAAGIDAEWDEPSVITVDISCAILPDTINGFSFDDLKIKVNDALITMMVNKGTGEDVYIADIIDEAMTIEGVLNVTVSDPASDVPIDVSEVARAGTIVITEI